MNRYTPLGERFWSGVNMSGDGCWPWTRTKNTAGYGMIKSAGTPRLAHRVAWELTNGPIPKGKQVCHKCDNPICVRPTHLFIGSQSENIRDMDRKGRRPKRPNAKMPTGDDHWRRRNPELGARGERAGGSKLNAEQVTEIRRRYAEGATLHQLGDEFGVSFTNIHMVVTRRTWRHIP